MHGIPSPPARSSLGKKSSAMLTAASMVMAVHHGGMSWLRCASAAKYCGCQASVAPAALVAKVYAGFVAVAREAGPTGSWPEIPSCEVFDVKHHLSTTPCRLPSPLL